MARLSRFEDIERLYAERGGLRYGEGVTQLQHALQCARLAKAADAGPALVVAALLHDIGHLLEDEEAAVNAAVDARHEASGARALAGLFGEAVCTPVALHVAAKRYLCFKAPQYVRGLSEASRASLQLQGGAFDMGEAAAFERAPYWREAVALRRFDDAGKRDELAQGAFADFAGLARSLLIGGEAS